MQETITEGLKKVSRALRANDLLLSTVIVLVVASIALVIGHYNDQVVRLYPKQHFHYTAEPGNPLSFMSNWDGPDYMNIASHGYHTSALSSFFPLYPLAIYALSFVIKSNLISGLAIAWISLVIAIFFYLKILKHLGMVNDTNDKIRSLAFFLLIPTGIFFLATYTESMFMMLSLSSVYFALTKRWYYSAPLLFLANLTHITGVLVSLLVGLMLLEEHEKLWKVILTPLIGLMGLATFMAYLKVRFNDAFAFIKSQTQIHQWLGHSFLSMVSSTNIFDALSIFLLIWSAIFFWDKRKSFSIYSISFLAIPILGRQYGGFNRYVIAAFPIPLMLYLVFSKRQNLYPYALVATTILWTYFALQYAGGYIGS